MCLGHMIKPHQTSSAKIDMILISRTIIQSHKDCWLYNMDNQVGSTVKLAVFLGLTQLGESTYILPNRLGNAYKYHLGELSDNHNNPICILYLHVC